MITFTQDDFMGDYVSDCMQYRIVKHDKKSVYIVCTTEDLVYMGVFNSLKVAEQFVNDYESNFRECADYIWNRRPKDENE